MSRNLATSSRPDAPQQRTPVASQTAGISVRLSPYLEQVRQRERALSSELAGLTTKSQQLQFDSQSLVLEKRDLDVREAKLVEQEDALWEQEASRLADVQKSTSELERQLKILSKTAADLNEQLHVAETQLEATRMPDRP
jgi:chromosome segregation ATPase